MTEIVDRVPLRAMPAQPGEASFWQLRIVVPFLIVSLIWGATWIVIRDQISTAPVSWSVTYRFLFASVAMFIVARMRGLSLNIGADGHRIAFLLGFFQFVANFNFVYRSELYITSGLVAVVFALLMVPNALLGRIFLGQRIPPAFIIGSLVAIAGVAGMFSHEFDNLSAGTNLWIGLGFALAGVLCASVANVMQGVGKVQQWPIISLLAWSMLWGTLGNAMLALFIDGAPVVPALWTYWGGVFYLGVIGSAVTFPLYFTLIRDIGPGRAAYSGVIVPITAMLLSTLVEGFSWTPLTIGGAVLGLAGLLIAMQARKPRTPRVVG
ncbi:MAG: DMT family transporter [Blastomonas sp.]